MKKFKLVTVVGTRPEIIRLSRVMATLDKYESIEHILVHTGQNYDYELNEVFFQDLETLIWSRISTKDNIDAADKFT